jgi:hypothetical protein
MVARTVVRAAGAEGVQGVTGSSCEKIAGDGELRGNIVDGRAGGSLTTSATLNFFWPV